MSNARPAPSLAVALVAHRLAAGESLTEAATQCGMPKSQLWEFESGKAANPTLDTLRRLAKHYGLSISQLIGEVPAPKMRFTPTEARVVEAVVFAMRAGA